MRLRTFSLIILSAALVGCDVAEVEVQRGEHAIAAGAPNALQLAERDLPGCELLGRQLATPASRWRIDRHPANPALAVLSRDACPVCVDTAARAREELGRLYTTAGLETPALISAPVDDDPVPIRGDQASDDGQDQGGDDAQGDDGQQPPPPGNGASNPQLASSPVPSDDPVPIRSLGARVMLVGSASTSNAK